MSSKRASIEDAVSLVTRVASETDLVVSETKSCIKVVSPGTGHKLYVHRTSSLTKIDSTLELEQEPEGRESLRIPLKAPNGAIRCHIVPSLEALEKALRLTADPKSGTRDASQPRPFAAARQPRPVVTPLPEAAVTPVPTVEGQTLDERLRVLRDRGRRARAQRLVENDETGTMTHELALRIVSGEISVDDLAHLPSRDARDVADARACGVEIEADA